MANIVLNDILDELREENNRLFNENNLIYDLLEEIPKIFVRFAKHLCLLSKIK